MRISRKAMKDLDKAINQSIEDMKKMREIITKLKKENDSLLKAQLAQLKRTR